MERLTIFIGGPNKSVAPTKYFFKVPQVGHFIPLIGVSRRCVESPLHLATNIYMSVVDFIFFLVPWKRPFSVSMPPTSIIVQILYL